MSSPSLHVIGIEDGVFVGKVPGFGGSIKCRAADFVVNEIDASGRVVEATSLNLPSPPVTPPNTPSTTTAAQTAKASTAVVRSAGDSTEQPSEPREDAGTVAGSGACDGGTRGTGACADSAGAAPSAPAVRCPAAAADKGNTPTEEEDESPEGWARQLQRYLGGSASKFAQLAKIDATARGAGTLRAPPVEEEDTSEDDGTVRVPAGHGADKAARARVHRAVQETFPFVKTATEKDLDGSVTVICTQAAPLPTLHGILSESDLEALQRMVNRGPGGIGAQAGVTLSSNGLDRAKRTLVHRAIAEAFPYLQTKTCSDPRGSKSQQVSIFWSRRRGGGGGGGNKRKRQGADSDGHQHGGGRGGLGDRPGSRWVRFGLRKEGCEHHRTALALSKVLRVPLSALSFGGIKDKIAITTQACVVKGVPPRKILETNGSIAGVTVGNLSYCKRGLSLGDLSGNKFSVVVRGAKVSPAAVKNALEEACSAKVGGGFVNFFGTQRVGSPAAAARGQPLPFEIGRDVLSGDWEAAVTKILHARENDPPFLKAALSDFLNGRITPKECAARVRGSNRLAMERLVLQGLVRYGTSAFQAAVQCVPYGMRTMWVHAYQSHVWNSLACARIRLLGPGAVPGDLVYPAEEKYVNAGDLEDSSPGALDTANASAHRKTRGNHEDSTRGVKRSPPIADAASACSISREADDPNKPPSASAVVGEIAEERKVIGAAAGTSGTHATTGLGTILNSKGKGAVTILTREMINEFASEGITSKNLMRRVVLPLAGTSIKYPTHEIGAMYHKRLEQDGVDSLMWPAPTPTQTSQDRPEQLSMLSAKAAGAETGQKLEQPAINSVHAEARVNKRDSVDRGRDKAVAGSALVPKGAYRRLLCVPTDVSWEPTAPWTSADREDDKRVDGPSESRIDGQSKLGPGPAPQAIAVGLDADGGGTAPTGEVFSPRGEGDESCPSRDVGKAVEGAGRAHGSSATAGTDEVLADVRLTFTLPPGSFATMFLREVMKRNDDIASSGIGGIEEEGGAREVEVDGCSVVLS